MQAMFWLYCKLRGSLGNNRTVCQVFHSFCKCWSSIVRLEIGFAISTCYWDRCYGQDSKYTRNPDTTTAQPAAGDQRYEGLKLASSGARL